MKRYFAAFLAVFVSISPALAQPAAVVPAPVPLVSSGHPAQWIFAYKFNATSFPSNLTDPARVCPFGGAVRPGDRFSQQYVYSTSAHPALQMGTGLIGTSLSDPLGATFSEIYNGNYFYVVWNDQFQTPPIPGGSSGTGHSKGMLVWNQNGDGLVLQVSTPGWPGAGNTRRPRVGDGNTLGCLTRIGNNLQFAQHFFALQLSPADVLLVLQALVNSNVVTSPDNPTTHGESIIRHIGGPLAIRTAAAPLGRSNGSLSVTDAMLSSGVRLISKPPGLAVTPWQLVSAVLTPPGAANGPALRTATWAPSIMPESPGGDPACWGFRLHPGPIAIARQGSWNRVPFRLGSSSNHAKIGVSVGGPPWYTIFSDLNQDGPLAPVPRTGCGGRQNGRGGMFFVLDNRALHDSVAGLIAELPIPRLP